MFNKRQRASLAKMAYKFAELLTAGVVIGGIMQKDPPLAAMTITSAVIPIALIAGLVIESGDDEDKPP